MKRRYHGIVVVGIVLAVMAAIAFYTYTGHWQNPDAVRRLPPQAGMHLKVHSGEQVLQMDRLYDRLPKLAAPEKRPVAANKLTLFGYEEAALAASRKGDRDSESLEPNDFRLSLVILAGFGRYCIIDGDFVSEGTRMEDGTAILKIESHRVLVARDQERLWIYLEDGNASSATTVPKDTSGQQRGQS